MQATKDFGDLVKLVSILREKCPWDRKQTHHSIKDNLIEEAYEAVEAIDENNFDELKKELGDVLLHVVFQAQMASEAKHFSIEEVIESLMQKLIRRHPHVFGEVSADNSDTVAENWELIKLKEGKKSTLDGLPGNLPALIKAQRMQEKAANVGFDWPEWQQAWDKLSEEMEEFREVLNAGRKEEQQKEFGDVLFSIVNAGRFFGLTAEDSLRLTNAKFEKRFRYIEEHLKAQGKSLKESNLEEMDRIWEEAKSQE